MNKILLRSFRETGGNIRFGDACRNDAAMNAFCEEDLSMHVRYVLTVQVNGETRKSFFLTEQEANLEMMRLWRPFATNRIKMNAFWHRELVSDLTCDKIYRYYVIKIFLGHKRIVFNVEEAVGESGVIHELIKQICGKILQTFNVYGKVGGLSHAPKNLEESKAYLLEKLSVIEKENT